jgi:hypothetical protein
VASTKYSHAEFDDITDKGEALLSMDDISVILSWPRTTAGQPNSNALSARAKQRVHAATPALLFEVALSLNAVSRSHEPIEAV